MQAIFEFLLMGMPKIAAWLGGNSITNSKRYLRSGSALLGISIALYIAIQFFVDKTYDQNNLVNTYIIPSVFAACGAFLILCHLCAFEGKEK